MTQEEKQLLLKDLCARLPYEVKIKIGEFSDYMLIGIDTTNDKQPLIIRHADGSFTCSIGIAKPYLRPMSSMTEGEKKYISDKCGFSIVGPISNECELIMPVLAVDWLIDFYNEHHIDYRGLIPMDLALEAKEGMYKEK